MKRNNYLLCMSNSPGLKKGYLQKQWTQVAISSFLIWEYFS